MAGVAVRSRPSVGRADRVEARGFARPGDPLRAAYEDHSRRLIRLCVLLLGRQEAAGDAEPSENGWEGVQRGVVRHRRRVMATRAALAIAVLGGFAALLVWVTSPFAGHHPGPPRVVGTPPSPSKSPARLGTFVRA